MPPFLKEGTVIVIRGAKILNDILVYDWKYCVIYPTDHIVMCPCAPFGYKKYKSMNSSDTINMISPDLVISCQADMGPN